MAKTPTAAVCATGSMTSGGAALTPRRSRSARERASQTTFGGRPLRQTTSELLGGCREDPECLLHPDDPNRDPRSFTLARSQPLGKKGGLDKGSFAAELRTQTTDFYRELVQNLRPPRPKAPKPPAEKQKQQPPEEQVRPTVSGAETRREKAAGLEDIAELGGLGFFGEGG